MPEKKDSSAVRARKRHTSTSGEAASTLDLVRGGVRRFIMDVSSIDDFRMAFRTAVKKGELSPNPLTPATFRKIVKDAIKERKRRTKRMSGR